jgi:N-sulfoglucosamine sulfohydrolase
VKPGGDSCALISGEDLAPTLLDAAGLEAGAKMSGVSFLPLLKGEAHTPRKHLFVERGPHGSAPVQADMTNAGYDLARAVRSDRFKFIYNCTPLDPVCARRFRRRSGLAADAGRQRRWKTPSPNGRHLFHHTAPRL